MKEIDKKKKKSEKQTYYMPICMCLGVSFGLCIGSVIDARNRTKANVKAEIPHEETE